MMKSFDCCVNESLYDGLLRVIARRNLGNHARDMSTFDEARMAEEMFRNPFDAPDEDDDQPDDEVRI